jgi:TonB-dependent starch-binding outer membrane protein SusC
MNRKFYRDVWLLLLLMTWGVGLARAGNDAGIFPGMQEKTVTGQIKSSDGEALPGVNIVIKGSALGTVTDGDGRYTLNVPDVNAVLVFSFIGFAPEEVIVGGQSVINVTLTPSLETLSEVVVIGYGTVKKTDLTGSVSSIKADELRAVPTTSFDQALQGRAAGVQVVQTSGQPGAESSIRIRGISSINAANEPLYVIDGMLMNSSTSDVTPGGGVGNSPRIGALSAINPNDIESIEILKDASATAIYGSRGTNGVVLITTKRGKKGTNTLNFEGYYGFQRPSRKLDLLNASQFAQFVNDGLINGGQTPQFVNPPNLGRGTDWQEEIFRTAPMRNYQLSFAGGSDKTQYVVSGGYFDQEGVVINTDFKRYSFRTNVNTEVSKRFSIGSNFMFGYTKGSAINTGMQAITPGVIGAALGMNPILPVYDPTAKGGYTKENDRGIVIGNPVAEALEHAVKSTSARVLGNVEARYKILDWLEFKSSIGIDATFAKDRSFAPDWLKSAQGSKGEAGIAELDAMTWLNENTLTVNKDIGEKSNINAVIGYTAQEFTNERVVAYVFGISDPRMGYNNLSGGSSPQPPGSGASKWSMTSYLGRIQYSLNGKYIFTATGRIDGSSKFAKQNRYGFFPSGAVAWRISEESFMQDVDVISDLKLRSSIGIIGNQAIAPYESLSLVAPYGQGVFNNGNSFTYYTSNQPTGYSNPDLKWETTRQFNVGIDFGFLQDRITIAADYFQKYTYDLLLSTPIPVTNGFGWTLLNIGNLKNNGFDIDLRTVNTTGVVKWNTSFNISRYRNEVTKLATPNDDDVLLDLSRVILRKGEPIGTFYGYKFDGIFQSNEEAHNSAVFVGQENTPGNKGVAMAGDRKYQDVVQDNVIDGKDRTIIGHALPDFVWGMNNNVSFKNFTLSVFIQGSQGNQMANLNQAALEDFRGVQNVSAKAALNAWTPENQSNRYPRALANRSTDVGTFSSAYVEDASYVRVKNITLGYDLPSPVLDRIKARSVRVYVSATNLVTITDYSGFDPEGSSYGTTTSLPGIDQGRYPLNKTYLVGLNIGF